MWNSWNPVHYDCGPCFTAPTHSFVVWLAPCLPVGKRHERIKPLARLCRVWDCQDTSSSAGVQPLALCRGSREMQGRRSLTARGAQGSGIVLQGWGSRAFMEQGPCLLTWCRSALCKWKATHGSLRPGNTISIGPFSPPNVKDSSVAINGSGKMDFLSTELGEHMIIKGQQWLLKSEGKEACLFKNLMQCSAMRCFEQRGKSMNLTYFYV